MNVGKVDAAVRDAVHRFEQWNDITGAVNDQSSWYWELQSVIEDAVHIGIRAALDKPYRGIENLTDGDINDG